MDSDKIENQKNEKSEKVYEKITNISEIVEVEKMPENCVEDTMNEIEEGQDREEIDREETDNDLEVFGVAIVPNGVIFKLETRGGKKVLVSDYFFNGFTEEWELKDENFKKMS
jgi:hypothetical protein